MSIELQNEITTLREEKLVLEVKLLDVEEANRNALAKIRKLEREIELLRGH